MQTFIDQLILNNSWLGFFPVWAVYASIQIFFGGIVLVCFVTPVAGILSWLERRIAGRMMNRIGPNRVGPQGFFQWAADGLKLLLKEDLIPKDANPPLFYMAPYLVFTGMFGAFAVIPFSSRWVGADLNVGIIYMIAITSLVTVGIVMGGWASNNKWSLLGGMRSAAQIISYEIPAGLGIFVVVLLTGSLSIQEIIKAQGAMPYQWFIFANPFTVIAFFITLIAAVAEGNRTPFDIPEAESELVAGYNTEYSGMRFVIFFFAEWANIYVIGAVVTILYLGGWQISGGLRSWGLSISPIVPYFLELATFLAKAAVFVFFVIWLRWTLPRLRVDQLMVVCWKYLVPAGFVAVLGTAGWMILLPKGSIFVNYLLALTAAAVLIYFLWRVAYQLWASKSRIHLNPFL